VKNALEKAPQEIRDRVIVVAVGPGIVVPDRLCFKAFNYASEKDIVYKIAPGPSRPLESVVVHDLCVVPHFGEAPSDDREELIILPANPEAKGIDHEFQSPTFEPPLKNVIDNYNKHGGEYLPEEKGTDFLGKAGK
jgi:hypothetical protein